MKKLVNLTAVTVLSLGVLAACGSGDDASGDYCTDLKATAEKMSGFGAGDSDQMNEVFGEFHKLAAEAPEDIAGPWKTLDATFTKVEESFAEAGVTPEQMANAEAGQNLSEEQRAKLTQVFAAIQPMLNQDFEDARKQVAADAKERCDVTLDM